MKEEDTRKPEHPEDPRQARQQAPVRLIKEFNFDKFSKHQQIRKARK